MSVTSRGTVLQEFDITAGPGVYQDTGIVITQSVLSNSPTPVPIQFDFDLDLRFVLAVNPSPERSWIITQILCEDADGLTLVPNSQRLAILINDSVGYIQMTAYSNYSFATTNPIPNVPPAPAGYHVKAHLYAVRLGGTNGFVLSQIQSDVSGWSVNPSSNS